MMWLVSYRCYFDVEDFVKILLISISVNDIVRVRNNLFVHFWPINLPIFFVLKILFAFCICSMYSSALQTRFFQEENTMNADKTAPLLLCQYGILRP